MAAGCFWGATTQTITQTGDVLILRKCSQGFFLAFSDASLTALADLAERSAEMVMAERTVVSMQSPLPSA